MNGESQNPRSFVGAKIAPKGVFHSSDDTPSVSHSLDSSLREGAGNGCVPFNGPLGKREVAGDFHRPYETQNI